MDIGDVCKRLEYPGESGVQRPRQPGAASDKTKERAAEKVLKDEYIDSAKSGEKPSGLYRVEEGADGRRKIIYEDPARNREKRSDRSEEASPEPFPPQTENCTTNTDKTDREIEKLKETARELERQIRQAAGDEEKRGELEARLAAVQQELAVKDNDAYRRQNAAVS